MPLHLLLASLRLTLWLTHLLLANTLLSLLLPLSHLLPTTTYNLSSLIARTVWSHIQRIFTSQNGAHIRITGDPLPAGESAIVVCNHVEWTDFYLIQELALRAGMLGRCRWFAKKELKWVPFLGWGLWAMGMPLVSREWTRDQYEMDRVFDGVVGKEWPMWLISFSESTRLKPSTLASARRHAAATQKTLPPHLLLPRTKGFAACVRNLRAAPHVRAVYDLTVAYAEKTGPSSTSPKKGTEGESGFRFQSPPTFLQSLFLPRIAERWEMLVHVRRFEVGELPGDEEGLRVWLEERWGEKGALLEELRGLLERGEGWGGMEEKEKGV